MTASHTAAKGDLYQLRYERDGQTAARRLRPEQESFLLDIPPLVSEELPARGVLCGVEHAKLKPGASDHVHDPTSPRVCILSLRVVNGAPNRPFNENIFDVCSAVPQ